MTEMQQLIAMLERSATPFHITDGTRVIVEGWGRSDAEFVFSVGEQLTDVFIGPEYGC